MELEIDVNLVFTSLIIEKKLNILHTHKNVNDPPPIFFAKKQIIIKNNRLKNVKSKSKSKKSNLTSNKHWSHITSRVATKTSNCQIHHKKELKIKDGGISHSKSKDIAVTVTPFEIENIHHKNELKIKESGISHFKSKDSYRGKESSFLFNNLINTKFI